MLYLPLPFTQVTSTNTVYKQIDKPTFSINLYINTHMYMHVWGNRKLLFCLISVVNTVTKNNLGRKGFFHLTLPDYISSLREVGQEPGDRKRSRDHRGNLLAYSPALLCYLSQKSRPTFPGMATFTGGVGPLIHHLAVKKIAHRHGHRSL